MAIRGAVAIVLIGGALFVAPSEAIGVENRADEPCARETADVTQALVQSSIQRAKIIADQHRAKCPTAYADALRAAAEIRRRSRVRNGMDATMSDAASGQLTVQNASNRYAKLGDNLVDSPSGGSGFLTTVIELVTLGLVATAAAKSGNSPALAAAAGGFNPIPEAGTGSGYRPIPEGNGGSGYRQIPESREDLAAPVLPGEPTVRFGYVTNANPSYNLVCAGKVLGVGSRQARICREWAGQASAAPAPPAVGNNSGSFYNQKPAWSGLDSGSASTGKMYTSANQCVGFDPAGYMLNSCNTAIEVSWCVIGASTDSDAYKYFDCGSNKGGASSVRASGRSTMGIKLKSGTVSFFACEYPAIATGVTRSLTGLRARGCR